MSAPGERTASLKKRCIVGRRAPQMNQSSPQDLSSVKKTFSSECLCTRDRGTVCSKLRSKALLRVSSMAINMATSLVGVVPAQGDWREIERPHCDRSESGSIFDVPQGYAACGAAAHICRTI